MLSVIMVNVVAPFKPYVEDYFCIFHSFFFLTISFTNEGKRALKKGFKWFPKLVT
jgi:hypothetical protein